MAAVAIRVLPWQQASKTSLGSRRRRARRRGRRVAPRARRRRAPGRRRLRRGRHRRAARAGGLGSALPRRDGRLEGVGRPRLHARAARRDPRRGAAGRRAHLGVQRSASSASPTASSLTSRDAARRHHARDPHVPAVRGLHARPGAGRHQRVASSTTPTTARPASPPSTRSTRRLATASTSPSTSQRGPPAAQGARAVPLGLERADLRCRHLSGARAKIEALLLHASQFGEDDEFLRSVRDRWSDEQGHALERFRRVILFG